MARVGIIIPTWNGKALLCECLDSLRAQTFRDFAVHVIDDGSTDGTAGLIREHYPEVDLVEYPENRGFCSAVNAGIAAAAEDLLLLLNNDMTLDSAFVERMVTAADASEAALFAPLILWRDDPARIYGAGDLQRTNGRPESIGFRQPLEDFQAPGAIFGVCAGAALYRRRVFEAIGLFDEQFHIYFSDSDISFRARLAGFDAAFVPEAIAYHVGSASLLGLNWKRCAECYRNHLLLVVKNMPWTVMMRHAPAILAERIHQARSLFSAARCEFGAVGAARTLLRSWDQTRRALPYAFRARRPVQRLRRITNAKLESLLTGGTGT